MINLDAFQAFRQGLTMLRDGKAWQALERLQLAADLDPINPYYISYLGVAKACAERKWADAEELCQTAVRMNRRQAQLYLNLAEVYVKADRRQDAADILARGLHYAPHDVRLKMALGKLSVRRPPVLRFLPRWHFLNRQLGRLRHRALQYLAEL